MINNLIFDQIKLIWINLELYFKIYRFSNFIRFFMNLKSIYLIKNQFYKCAGDVAQSGASDRVIKKNH